jgi:hypothetical protein
MSTISIIPKISNISSISSILNDDDEEISK